MTLTSGILWRRRSGDLVESDAFVDAGLGWEAQHPLADDVALDLVGAAPDGDRRRREEERQPVVLADLAAEALEVDGQVGHGLDGGRPPKLGARALGAGCPPRGPRRSGPQRSEPARLQSGDHGGQTVTGDGLV